MFCCLTLNCSNLLIIPGVLISLLVIERLGRRKLLLISQIGSICSIALVVAAIAMVDSMAMKDSRKFLDPYSEFSIFPLM